MTVSGSVTVAGSAAGRLEFDGEIGSGGTNPSNFRLKSEQFPLGLLRPVLARFDATAKLDGRLSGSFNANLAGGDNGRVALDGDLSVQNLAWTNAGMGTDRVTLAKADLPCRLTKTGTVWNIDTLKLTCDLGTASVKGQFDLAGDPLAVLAQPGIEVVADLDLAQLCALLPHTLHLQPGTRIISGHVVANAQSASAANGIAWSGRLFSLNLRGERAGQPLVIDTPITLDFAVRNIPNALPQIDRLQCGMDFLKLEATGSAEKLSLSGDLDLGLLEKRLGQFVDFGAIHPAGHGNLRMTVARDNAGGLKLDANGQLTDLAVNLPVHGHSRKRNSVTATRKRGSCTASRSRLRARGCA